MRVGLDVDGVLIDFNNGYRDMLAHVSGRQLIPRPFDVEFHPPCWEYAPFFGYTAEEDRATWKAICSSTGFWLHLSPYRGVRAFLNRLWFIEPEAVYFITTRPGTGVQHQTVASLPYPEPSVLIARTSEDKGVLAAGLGLTHFLDDKPENCLAVKSHVPDCKVYLLDYAYNRWAINDPRYADIVRISSLKEFEQVLNADSQKVAA